MSHSLHLKLSQCPISSHVLAVENGPRGAVFESLQMSILAVTNTWFTSESSDT